MEAQIEVLYSCGMDAHAVAYTLGVSIEYVEEILQQLGLKE